MLGHGEGQEFSTTAITAKGKNEKRFNHGGHGGHDEKQNRPRAFQPRRIRRKTGKTMRNAGERESGRFLSPFTMSVVFAMSAKSAVPAVPAMSGVSAVGGAFSVQVMAVPFSPSFPRTRESSSCPPARRAANSSDAALRAGMYTLDSRFRGNDGNSRTLDSKTRRRFLLSFFAVSAAPVVVEVLAFLRN
jgi:hypothetical protein